MAGSYNHCIDDNGYLLSNDEMMISEAMIENLGDAYEAIEELYGMIWFLASTFGAPAAPPSEVKVVVESARVNYKKGLEIAKEVNKQT